MKGFDRVGGDKDLCLVHRLSGKIIAHVEGTPTPSRHFPRYR